MTDKIMAIIATFVVVVMFGMASVSAFYRHDRFTAIAAAIGFILTTICAIFLWRASVRKK